MEQRGARSPEPRQWPAAGDPDHRAALSEASGGNARGLALLTQSTGREGSEVGPCGERETQTSPHKPGRSRGRGPRQVFLTAGTAVKREECGTKVSPSEPQRTTQEVKGFPSTGGSAGGSPRPGRAPTPPAVSRCWTNREGARQDASVPRMNVTTPAGDQIIRCEPAGYPLRR